MCISIHSSSDTPPSKKPKTEGCSDPATPTTTSSSRLNGRASVPPQCSIGGGGGGGAGGGRRGEASSQDPNGCNSFFDVAHGAGAKSGHATRQAAPAMAGAVNSQPVSNSIGGDGQVGVVGTAQRTDGQHHPHVPPLEDNLDVSH